MAGYFEGDSMPPRRKRINICRLYCANVPHVHVSDVEMIELLCQWNLSHNACKRNTHPEIIMVGLQIQLQFGTYILKFILLPLELKTLSCLHLLVR